MESLYEPEFIETLTSCRVLLVGVGGIGCEILKQLTVLPFRRIEIVKAAKVRSTWTQSSSATSTDSSTSVRST